MPRLDSSVNNSNNQPGVASAYPNFRNLALLKILGIFFTILLLKNVMFKDYKKQEIEYLRASGKTEEEIAQYIDPMKSSSKKTRRGVNAIIIRHSYVERRC
uniref:Uncharacterized protein n=1 Tax=Eucampia antarctica TaxID=49252 RepID=A0A7S2W0I0_9STRA|mmetsp:Transcript_17090/g.16522  ORF Transcript_17090/g.16522 Transcript_17090/m.16522 type:complete len:101 (+) Transcript_17090:206-508(+)